MKKIFLSKDSDFEVYEPSIDFFLEKIIKGEFFSFTRQLHGFWDAIIGALILDPSLRSLSREEDWLRKLSLEMVNAKNAMIPLRYNAEIYFDVLNMMVNLDQYPLNFYFGVSDVNFYTTDLPEHSANDAVSGFPAFRLLPVKSKLRCFTPKYGDRQQIIRYFLPDNYIPYNGVVWRKYGYQGSLIRLFEMLKQKPVVIVGPEHYATFGQLTGLELFFHIPIHGTLASSTRDQILNDIKQLQKKISGKGPVTIFFVAGTLSCWLINKLHGKLHETWLIDTGLALDSLFSLKDVKNRNQYQFIGAKEANPATLLKNKPGSGIESLKRKGNMVVDASGRVTFEIKDIKGFLCFVLTIKAKLEFFIAYKLKIYQLKKYKLVRRMVNYYWQIWEKKL